MTTKYIRRPRKSTAYHEAGHAVIGRVLTLKCGQATIEPDFEKGGGGHASGCTEQQIIERGFPAELIVRKRSLREMKLASIAERSDDRVYWKSGGSMKKQPRRHGPTVQIPIDQIEPHLCTSTAAVRRYVAMFKAGEFVEPILIERSGPGYRYPFQIYNGAHRMQAASLAGRTVIDAKIVE
jgi:hypothetical protein